MVIHNAGCQDCVNLRAEFISALAESREAKNSMLNRNLPLSERRHRLDQAFKAVQMTRSAMDTHERSCMQIRKIA
jgi:hypothetical protein